MYFQEPQGSHHHVRLTGPSRGDAGLMRGHQPWSANLLKTWIQKVNFNKEYGVMRVWIYEENEDGKMKEKV